MPEIRKVLLVINPNAGNGRAGAAEEKIERLFQLHGYQTDVRHTRSPDDARKMAAIHGSSCDLVVCCGGDGTLSEVANGLLDVALRKRPAIGYLPAGTTNDVARSLGISMDIEEATESILRGKRRVLDIGRFNNRYFVYIASFGAFTATSYSTPQSLKKAWGHLAYVLEGIKDLASIKPLPLTVQSAEKQYDEPFIFGAVCNSTSIAGLLTLDSRLVSFNDGLFEVLLIRPPTDARALVSIITALQTQDYDGPWVLLYQTRAVQIVSNEPIDWSLDGEQVADITNASIENRHGELVLIG